MKENLLIEKEDLDKSERRPSIEMKKKTFHRNEEDLWTKLKIFQ